MTEQDRYELAQRLRWLAGKWTQADNRLRRKIEEAFDRGLHREPEVVTSWQEILEQV